VQYIILIIFMILAYGWRLQVMQSDFYRSGRGRIRNVPIARAARSSPPGPRHRR
jgi:hypothetical protein